MIVLSFLVLVGLGVGFVVWLRRTGMEQAEHPAPAGDRAAQRRALLVEAVAYVGTVLVLAGGVAAVGQHWSQIATGWRLAILLAAAAVLFAVGWAVRASAEPALHRLTAATWAVSVIAFGGATAVLVQHQPGRTAFPVIVGASTAYGAVLWLLNQRALQQLVVYVGLLLTLSALWGRALDSPRTATALTLWGLGVGWAALGHFRRLPPWWLAVPLGALTALVAPASLDSPWRYVLGLGTAGAAMGIAVATRLTPGLVLGAVALLGYVVGLTTEYLADSLGVPAALSIAGFAILVVAAGVLRLHARTREHPPVDRPAEERPREPVNH